MTGLFSYVLSMFSKNFYDNVTALFVAIEASLEQNLILPALALIYTGIDVMA